METIEEKLGLVRNELDTGNKMNLDRLQAEVVIQAFSRYDALDQTVHWFTATSEAVNCKSIESQDWNEAMDDLCREYVIQVNRRSGRR